MNITFKVTGKGRFITVKKEGRVIEKLTLKELEERIKGQT